ncbi:hypothetical protein [Streptomyces sp. NBC_01565]|uniref:hypothetical protein n=1 Tax=unclassified Streptomyces TaxID=2593676 RepID=UPI0022590D5D|nr:hypothetical protein [Streptomyces sp. NBC_01565]MCX4545573.1 hypothetical protein [Streptomyces sp. NBC_01565]
MNARRSGWTAFTLWVYVLAFVWGLCFVWVSEQDERCAHGFVGPGGGFTVERGYFPPDVTCVWADGTETSGLGRLEYLWWATVLATAVSPLVVTARRRRSA